MAANELKQRKRSDYPYILEYRTRWSDNDMYDHMNNSVYSFLYDSVVNTYLIDHCALQPPTSPVYGLVVSSQTQYFSSIAFPAIAELGLRIAKLGNSSVEYEFALFEKGVEGVKSVGGFTHVFVERSTGRPRKEGMEDTMRRGLERLVNKVGERKEGGIVGRAKL